MRASATHAGRGLSSSLIRTTTFHIKIHKVWQLHVISADVWLGILCFFSYGCWRRRGFNWVVTFYMIVSRCWWTHAFGLASAFLLCCVFFFFVDFLKILEIPSNVFVAWPVKRIEHAGDPSCSGIWCPYPDDSIRSLKSWHSLQWLFYMVKPVKPCGIPKYL